MVILCRNCAKLFKILLLFILKNPQGDSIIPISSVKKDERRRRQTSG